MTDAEFTQHINALMADVRQGPLPLTRDKKLLALCKEFLKTNHFLTTLYAKSPEDRVVNIYYCKRPPCK